MKTFKELKIWQKSHALTLAVYRETRSFPRDELYGLTSQLRRAALSTATNIVEGHKRRSPKDFAHFINMAQASNDEVKYLILVSSELAYLTPEARQSLDQAADEVGAMLHVFANKLRNGNEVLVANNISSKL